MVQTVVVVVAFKDSRGLKYGHIPRLCPSRDVTARQGEEYCIFYGKKKTPGRPAISLLARREQCKTSFNLPNRFIFQNATLHGEIFLKTLCNYKIIINKKLLNTILPF